MVLHGDAAEGWPGPGDTGSTSPPLTGLAVRRCQILSAGSRPQPFLRRPSLLDISCGGELAPRFLNTPLHQPGLNRRMYPFLGLAIVGLVTVKPLTAVTTSSELIVALL